MSLIDTVKPNTSEVVILFALYIAIQDHELSTDEEQKLLDQIKFFIGSIVVTNTLKPSELKAFTLNAIKFIKKKTTWQKVEISDSEIEFFEKGITTDDCKELCLQLARIVSSADEFVEEENSKYNYWVQRFLSNY